ncbi:MULTISPECIES: hypothetical protein [unclassified Pseudoalteromonas]|uniref:hypothetical protein n=1 Tax=unclassified Pseudoalteromonas TaxID=194690 RepID=UPI00094FC05D|nr:MULTISPECIES: hypothetical protein [unclassified Pseudoalteromonas]QLJ08760.1 hypothetical protein GZH31_02570 [Pseudoalteromonas sp. JSTW]
MSIYKLFTIASIAFLSCFLIRADLQEPLQNGQYGNFKEYDGQDKPYLFNVPEDGQMMRFEIKGRLPLNSWKAIDIEIFDPEGNYLFSYSDELWAETGRDSEGKWTEYREKVHHEVHFPKKGQYSAYVSSSFGPNTRAEHFSYSFRIIPIKGNSNILLPFMWLSGIVAGMCIFVVLHRFEAEREGSDITYKPINKLNPEAIKAMETRVAVWPIVLLFFTPIGLASMYAYSKNNDERDWLMYSLYHSNITVDKQLREQSIGSPGFRSRGGSGGK